MKKTTSKTPGQRPLRMGELVRRALAEALKEGHFRDPALVDASVTITEVRMSPDLRHAMAFVMPLGGKGGKETIEALNRASAFFRTFVGKAIKARSTPDIHFVMDTSFDYAQHINELLHSDAVKKDLED